MTTPIMKHEVLAAAAIKRFQHMLEGAPRCKCGSKCETRQYLLRQLRSRDSQANRLFAQLFDEVLSGE